MPKLSVRQRFVSKVARRSLRVTHMRSYCDEWTGAKSGDGYGSLNVDGKTIGAHRVAWFLKTGEWPKQPLLHACDNPPCVRFEHLSEGTHSENMRDMYRRNRHPRKPLTHCANNHEYTDATRYVSPKGTGYCRICHRNSTARSRAKTAT